jgi:ABC-type multidrug transport system permease subunit
LIKIENMMTSKLFIGFFVFIGSIGLLVLITLILSYGFKRKNRGEGNENDDVKQTEEKDNPNL